jgi:DNA ligase-1
MTLPKLYKKTSTGAIQEWLIFVKDVGTAGPVICIFTQYGGQVGGKIQETSDLISKGKNIGKINETTPLEQAQLEARAKWDKQKKKGYVERIDDAEADAVDALIEGGVVPMLAQSFSKHGHKIKYPCFVQPKLDGIRCIAIIRGGECTLWSRTRKPITSCPHIVQELEAIFENARTEIILDGELYNDNFKSNFEHIVHLVRQEIPDQHHTDVQYHIYDMVSGSEFSGRSDMLYEWLADVAVEDSSLRLVETVRIKTEDQVMEYFEKFRDQGFEGAMLRNQDSRYVSKRSYDLQKVKEFEDDEFTIVGIEEGRGKLAGHVGAFVCRTADGKEFLAKMSGETEKLREYFNNHGLWEGKNLTVQFQGFTGKEKVPRFPVGIAIRDYE